MAVRVTFLGSGDAFGSGGRLQTCFHVEAADGAFLIDCGTSVLVSMRRFGVEPNAVSAIVLSHLHGDHFGGVPFFLLEAQFVSRRETPLTVAGPPSTRERVERLMETSYPGSAEVERRFATEFVELEAGRAQAIAGASVTPYEVRHPSGAPAYALRIECGGCVIAYSGDTEWVDTLVPAAAGADLFIAEAYSYEQPIPYHLDLRTLVSHLDELRPKRLVLTHMGADMIERSPQLGYETAEDGKVLEIAPGDDSRLPPGS